MAPNARDHQFSSRRSDGRGSSGRSVRHPAATQTSTASSRGSSTSPKRPPEGPSRPSQDKPLPGHRATSIRWTENLRQGPLPKRKSAYGPNRLSKRRVRQKPKAGASESPLSAKGADSDSGPHGALVGVAPESEAPSLRTEEPCNDASAVGSHRSQHMVPNGPGSGRFEDSSAEERSARNADDALQEDHRSAVDSSPRNVPDSPFIQLVALLSNCRADDSGSQESGESRSCGERTGGWSSGRESQQFSGRYQTRSSGDQARGSEDQTCDGTHDQELGTRFAWLERRWERNGGDLVNGRNARGPVTLQERGTNIEAVVPITAIYHAQRLGRQHIADRKSLRVPVSRRPAGAPPSPPSYTLPSSRSGLSFPKTAADHIYLHLLRRNRPGVHVHEPSRLLIDIAEPSDAPAHAPCYVCLQALADEASTSGRMNAPQMALSPLENHRPWVTSKCGHCFGAACLYIWINDPVNRHRTPGCPVCRIPLVARPGPFDGIPALPQHIEARSPPAPVALLRRNTIPHLPGARRTATEPMIPAPATPVLATTVPETTMPAPTMLATIMSPEGSEFDFGPEESELDLGSEESRLHSGSEESERDFSPAESELGTSPEEAELGVRPDEAKIRMSPEMEMSTSPNEGEAASETTGWLTGRSAHERAHAGVRWRPCPM